MDDLTIKILAVMVMIGVLVFVHEFGHYIVGRMCGIAVEIFSVGFGPSILSWKKRGTQYQIALLPLGGFVKFAGSTPSDLPEEAVEGKLYHEAPPRHRFYTALAGPFFNFMLSALIFFYFAFFGMKMSPATVGTVESGSPAQVAGLISQDEITSIDDQKIKSWRDMSAIISKSPEKKLKIGILREGSSKEVIVTPRSVERKDILGNSKKFGQIGIGQQIYDTSVGVDFNSKSYQHGLRSGDKIVQLWGTGVTNQKTKVFDVIYQEQIFTSLSYLLESITIDKLTNLHIKTTKNTISIPLAATDTLQNIGLISGELTFSKIKKSPENPSAKVGDRLLGFEQQKLKTIYELYEYLNKNKKPELQAMVDRNGQLVTYTVKLKPIEIQKPEGKVIFYGVPFEFYTKLKHPPKITVYKDGFLSAVGYSLWRPIQLSGEVAWAIINLFTGKVPLKSLGGPIMIAKIAGDSAKSGLQDFLLAMAVISINLFIINLFPMPVLDGGQVVMIFLEVLRGKPPSEAFMENYQKIGFVFVLCLMILAFSNDFSRFWSSILRTMTGG